MRKAILTGLFGIGAAIAWACGGEQPQAEPPPPPPPVAPTATTAPSASASAAPAASADPPKGPAPAWHLASFQTPESVLYDDKADRYLVSNINGKPLDVDGNGYISVVSPDGKVTTEKWIEGGKNKVTLNAPKGMTITGGVLYVADLDTVRTFDAKTGKAKAAIKIKGATFLNDVASDAKGKVYVSDSGMKANAKGGFDPTGTDAVWVISKGKAKPLAKGTDLGRPNGVLWTDKGVWVVTFGTNELYRLDDKGKMQDVTKLPKGSLDGLVMLPDGTFLVSSWESSSVYRGKPGGTFEAVITGVKSPADIGYDTKRSRVMVPEFMENTVEAYDVK